MVPKMCVRAHTHTHFQACVGFKLGHVLTQSLLLHGSYVKPGGVALSSAFMTEDLWFS